MNHCFEKCHYQQNVPQHYYLLDTLVLTELKLAAFTPAHVHLETHHHCGVSFGVPMSGTGTRQIIHRFGNFSICLMLFGLQFSPSDRVASL